MATINSLRDLKTGDKFSCRIQNVAVTGTITVGRDYIYLCQNKKRGGHHEAQISEQHGHKYVWAVPKPIVGSMAGMDTQLGNQSVTYFKVTKQVPRDTKVQTNRTNKTPKKASLQPITAPQTVDQEIASTKQKLADLEAKKARETQPIQPERLMDHWEIKNAFKGGKKAFSIGCGVVTVTEEEAELVARVLHNILTRTVYEGGNLRDKLKKTLKVAARLGNNPSLALK